MRSKSTRCRILPYPPYMTLRRKKKARAEGRDVCDSLEELLMRKDVDAVILAVPNNFLKRSLSRQCTRASVLCEKPVMMNSQDLLESSCGERADRNAVPYIRIAAGTGRDFCIVRECIQSGALGCPFYIESRAGREGHPGGLARCTQEAEAACCWIGASICWTSSCFWRTARSAGIRPSAQRQISRGGRQF